MGLFPFPFAQSVASVMCPECWGGLIKFWKASGVGSGGTWGKRMEAQVLTECQAVFRLFLAKVLGR